MPVFKTWIEYGLTAVIIACGVIFLVGAASTFTKLIWLTAQWGWSIGG